MMYKIYECDNAILPGNPLYADIIKLVKENSHELSMSIYTRTSLLYNYLATREVVRVDSLLENIGTSLNDLMVVEFEDTREIVGFIICSLFIDRNTQARLDGASITYLFVDPKYRMKGVMRTMLEFVQKKYVNMTLTCSPSLVPMYEKFGFIISGCYQTHISMTYGVIPNNGGLISIDEESVIAHPTVLQSYRSLVSSVGKIKAKKAVTEWQQDFNKGEEISRRFYEDYSSRKS